MRKLALQISPEVKGAYFSDYISVAEAELKQVFSGIEYEKVRHGALEFFIMDDTVDMEKLLRLSFAQGVYEVIDDKLLPRDCSASFYLHEDFVFGSKYKGKTNERLTQLLLNIGLSMINTNDIGSVKLLDPMCGRGTTLLWGLRYGINGWGIELDKTALIDIHRNLKKWTKIHRQKHQLKEGFIGETKKHANKYLDFSIDSITMRVINADTLQADSLFKKNKFDLIVSDLPYGVQHLAQLKSRNPFALLEECAQVWKKCLKQHGAIVLAFNKNNPKREDLIHLFEKVGLVANTFSAPHRMSESIVRDVLVLKILE